MQYVYQLRQDILTDETGKEWVVFGIEALDATGHILCSYSDIFFDKEKALEFVRICNEQNVELIHIQDIIGNVLAEQY